MKYALIHFKEIWRFIWRWPASPRWSNQNRFIYNDNVNISRYTSKCFYKDFYKPYIRHKFSLVTLRVWLKLSIWDFVIFKTYLMGWLITSIEIVRWLCIVCSRSLDLRSVFLVALWLTMQVIWHYLTLAFNCSCLRPLI